MLLVSDLPLIDLPTQKLAWKEKLPDPIKIIPCGDLLVELFDSTALHDDYNNTVLVSRAMSKKSEDVCSAE